MRKNGYKKINRHDIVIKMICKYVNIIEIHHHLLKLNIIYWNNITAATVYFNKTKKENKINIILSINKIYFIMLIDRLTRHFFFK